MNRKKHHKKTADNRRLIGGILIGLGILAFSIAVFFLFFSGKGSGEDETDTREVSRGESLTAGEQGAEEPETDPEEKEDPQSESNAIEAEKGAETEVTEILISRNASETDKVTLGIDVSKFQGTIDWKAVADAGIDFAMIRVGYRTQSSGEIREDTNARYNMQEATANGIQIGAYFFSTAVTEEEAGFAVDIKSARKSVKI